MPDLKLYYPCYLLTPWFCLSQEPVSRIQPAIFGQGIPLYGPQTTGGEGGAQANTGGVSMAIA